MGYTLSFEGPLIVTRIPQAMTDQEQAEYFERIEREVLAKRTRHVTMVLAGQSTIWTPEQRKRHHAFHKRNEGAIRELCAASALVMPEVSTIVRFALSAVMMLAPGSPATMFSEEGKARRWLQIQLGKAMHPTSAR